MSLRLQGSQLSIGRRGGLLGRRGHAVEIPWPSTRAHRRHQRRPGSQGWRGRRAAPSVSVRCGLGRSVGRGRPPPTAQRRRTRRPQATRPAASPGPSRGRRVAELRAAGDDDQVGDTSCFQRRVLGPGRRIDDDNVNVVRRGRGDGARQAGGLHSKHKWGFCGAAGAPLAGGRLGINVEHNGGPAGLFDSDGKGEGERGFPAPAFLRDDRYCIQHGDNTPWMYQDWLIIRLYTSYNMVYSNHVVIILDDLAALHRRGHEPAGARRGSTGTDALCCYRWPPRTYVARAVVMPLRRR